jgi:hypothetical protein
MGVDPVVCWKCSDSTNYYYSCSGNDKYCCEKSICKYCNNKYKDDDVLFCPDCTIIEEARKKKKKLTLEEVTKLKEDQEEVIKNLNVELKKYNELVKQKNEAKYQIRKYNLLIDNCEYCLKK